MEEAKTSIEATCPDCRGPLSEIRHGTAVEYLCLVGHRYSARALLNAHSDAQEKALWAAVVALEEAATLANRLAPMFHADVGVRLRKQAASRIEHASDIRKVIAALEPMATEAGTAASDG
jgi:two-component system, chemotaxis family, protein-glutamate methylesterase/glutaminase